MAMGAADDFAWMYPSRAACLTSYLRLRARRNAGSLGDRVPRCQPRVAGRREKTPFGPRHVARHRETVTGGRAALPPDPCPAQRIASGPVRGPESRIRVCHLASESVISHPSLSARIRVCHLVSESVSSYPSP